MGLFDKAKDAINNHQDDIKNQASQHSDQVEQGAEHVVISSDALAAELSERMQSVLERRVSD